MSVRVNWTLGKKEKSSGNVYQTVIHVIGNIALSSNNEKCFIFNVKRVPEMSIIPCRNVLVGFTLSSRRPYTFS